MNSEERFKLLVDCVDASFSPDMRINIKDLYSHYGLPLGGGFLLSEIATFLSERLRVRLLSAEKGLKWNDFRALTNQLIRQHIINGNVLLPYLSLVEIIMDEVRILNSGQYFLSFDHEEAWKDALRDAKDIIALGQYYGEDIDIYLRYPRIAKSANEVLWLQKEGFSGISVVNGNYDITPEGLLVLVNSIEQDIKRLGGHNVALRALEAISEEYDDQQGRYHLGRRCSTTGQEVVPQIPIGYLLNLSVKAGNFIVKDCSPGKDVNILARKLVVLGCLFDVQPYSAFELQFKTVDTILDFLREISLYDSLFTFLQQRPTDICKTIRGLFDWVGNAKIQEIFGCTLEQLIVVIDTILQISPPKKTIFFTAEFLSNKIHGLSSETVNKILGIFTHNTPEPNKDFMRPQDMSCVDFQFKPLLRHKENFCLLDASVCSCAFYEAIATALRESTSIKMDDYIGPAAERFLKSELTKRGVVYISGQYKHSGQDGECDIVVETTDTVIFIEVKKKSLTRKARGGSDVHLLLDISKSLIDSQIQLGNHEFMIRKNGFLELEDKTKKTYHLDLQGRAVERISLTVLDYGGIQDRRVISQLLSLVMNARFDVVDSQYTEGLEQLNEKCQMLHAQALELDAMGVWSKIPYFNCWFLSIPQFLVLLDNVHSGEDFKKELFRTRFVTFSSLDFYYELSCIRR